MEKTSRGSLGPVLDNQESPNEALGRWPISRSVYKRSELVRSLSSQTQAIRDTSARIVKAAWRMLGTGKRFRRVHYPCREGRCKARRGAAVIVRHGSVLHPAGIWHACVGARTAKKRNRGSDYHRRQFA